MNIASHKSPSFLSDEPELREHIEKLKIWRKGFVKRRVEDAA